jgi:hypothetical protein
MFMGTIAKGNKIDGYLSNNLLEPNSLHHRHNCLTVEMEERGYNHRSQMDFDQVAEALKNIEKRDWKIDYHSALKDLLSRCPHCKERYENKNK